MAESDSVCDLMNCGVLTQEISEEKKYSMLPTEILVIFCEESVCLKSLPDAKLKSLRLIQLVRENPKTTYFVVWFLVVTLMKIYKANEQDDQGKL